MRFTLGLTDLWDLFGGRVFSAAQVPRGKTVPDLFLHAAIARTCRPMTASSSRTRCPGCSGAVGRHAGAGLCRRALRRSRLRSAARRRLLFDDMKQLPALVLA
jgi:hypothetical protein